MVAVATLGCAVVAITLMGANHEQECTAIDWRIWRTSSSSDGPVLTQRQVLADRAIACRVLEGHSRQFVKARLGRPETGTAIGKRWRWVVGPSRGFPVDSEELVVEFDRGTVQTLRLATG